MTNSMKMQLTLKLYYASSTEIKRLKFLQQQVSKILAKLLKSRNINLLNIISDDIPIQEPAPQKPNTTIQNVIDILEGTEIQSQSEDEYETVRIQGFRFLKIYLDFVSMF